MNRPAPRAKLAIQSCDDLAGSSFHRLLILGAPKDGKTYTALCSAAGAKKEGTAEILLINSDDSKAWQAARDDGWRFDVLFAPGKNPQEMVDAIALARAAIAEGRYRSVIWDTLSKYSWRVLEAFQDASRGQSGEADGRKYWHAHRNHILQVVDQLLDLDAHVIVTSHWRDASDSMLIQGQIAKSGDGIVSDLPGELRKTVAGCFANVVFLRVDHNEKRAFLWKRMGQFGPGGRTLPKGVTECEADIQLLWRMIQERRESK